MILFNPHIHTRSVRTHLLRDTAQLDGGLPVGVNYRVEAMRDGQHGACLELPPHHLLDHLIVFVINRCRCLSKGCSLALSKYRRSRQAGTLTSSNTKIFGLRKMARPIQIS